MQYREIVSVTGLPGLFHLMSTKPNGAIVRNLADGTTKFIPARLHQVTPLESIEIYTTSQNVYLHDVLEAMQQNGTERPHHKQAGNDAIKVYFREVFPLLDEERVYVSDMKKMLRWYDLLKQNELLDFSFTKEAGADAPAHEEGQGPDSSVEEAAQVTEAGKEDQVSGEELVEAPAKKASAKKAAVDTDGEAEPEKKTARKKKAEAEPDAADAEEKETAPKKKAASKKKAEE